MRRISRNHVAAAIDRARPDLERFIAERLECPVAVPLTFTDPVAGTREIRSIRIAPRFRADYPPVDVLMLLHVAITARTRRRDVDLGTRTTVVDAQVDAIGTAAALGYEVAPQRAELVAWWGE